MEKRDNVITERVRGLKAGESVVFPLQKVQSVTSVCSLQNTISPDRRYSTRRDREAGTITVTREK